MVEFLFGGVTGLVIGIIFGRTILTKAKEGINKAENMQNPKP